MDHDFDVWWQMYPKRAGGNPRMPARKAWDRLIKFKVIPPMADLMHSTRLFYSDCSAQRILNTPYVPHAATWLNQRRWEGYAAPMPEAIVATTHPAGLPQGYEDAARALIKQIGAQRYAAFFGKAKWSNGGNVIKIHVASNFDRSTIEINYAEELERLTGKQVEVLV